MQSPSSYPDAAPPSLLDSRGMRWLLLVACLLPLVPLTVYGAVPGLDYMMHIARAAIESRSGSPFFRDMLTFDPVLIPNLGVDWVVPWLIRLMPPAVAGRVFVGICFLAQTTGALALMYAVQRRVTASAFLVPLLCYNLVAGYGFLGYMLGVGIALWGFASALLLESRPVWIRLVAMAAFGVGVYFCHLAAFGLMVASIGLYAFVRWPAPADRGAAGRSLLVLLVGCLPVVYIHLRLSNISQSTGTIRNGLRRWIHDLISFLNPYHSPKFFLLWVVVFATLIVLLATKRLRVERRLAFVSLALFALYVVTPFQLYGSYYASTRLLPYVALVFLSSLSADTSIPSRARLVGFAAFALVALQTLLVLQAWRGYTAYREPMLRGIRQAPPGTLFVVLENQPQDVVSQASLKDLVKTAVDNPYWQPNVDHLGDEVAMEGDYFPLQLYLIPGKQPVNIQPKYYDIYFPVNSAKQERAGAGSATEFARATPSERAERFRSLDFRPLNVASYPEAIASVLRNVDRDYRARRKESGIYPRAGAYVIYFHGGHPANPYPALLREVSHDDGYVNVYELRGR